MILSTERFFLELHATRLCASLFFDPIIRSTLLLYKVFFFPVRALLGAGTLIAVLPGVGPGDGSDPFNTGSQPNEPTHGRSKQRTGHHTACLDPHERAWIEQSDHRYRAEVRACDPRTRGRDSRHRQEGS